MTEPGFEARPAGRHSLSSSLKPGSSTGIPSTATWKPALPGAALISKLNTLLLVEAAVSCVTASAGLPGPSWIRNHCGNHLKEQAVDRVEAPEQGEGNREQTHAHIRD